MASLEELLMSWIDWMSRSSLYMKEGWKFVLVWQIIRLKKRTESLRSAAGAGEACAASFAVEHEENKKVCRLFTLLMSLEHEASASEAFTVRTTGDFHLSK